MKYFLLLFFFFSREASYIEAKCLEGCTCCDYLGIRIYEELGCEGVYKDGKTCPDYFTCPDYTISREYCMFGGRQYSIGQSVNGTTNCRHCKCKRGMKDGNMVGAVECGMHAACPSFKTDTCNNIYDLESCCPRGSQCSVAGNNDFECRVDGECYKEGEKFYPKDGCYECVCQRGYAGKYVAPYCRRKRCDVEVLYGDQVHRKCAPVYAQPSLPGVHGALCCPHRFICPEENCNVEIINIGFPDCQTCYLGTRAFAQNSTFYIHTKKYGGTNTALCSCNTPPLLTCVGN